MDQSTNTIWAQALDWLATTEVSLLAVLALFAAYGLREAVGLWMRRSRK
ncbi:MULTISPECIES: hypothetical protein [unclassified Mameliella]|nr:MULTISPECIES: hypothetical protein [unclassified Mameliella]